jgi:hypothetical protein
MFVHWSDWHSADIERSTVVKCVKLVCRFHLPSACLLLFTFLMDKEGR